MECVCCGSAGDRVSLSIDYPQDRLSRLHIGENVDAVGDVGEGGRVVVGIDHGDVDGHR